MASVASASTHLPKSFTSDKEVPFSSQGSQRVSMDGLSNGYGPVDSDVAKLLHSDMSNGYKASEQGAADAKAAKSRWNFGLSRSKKEKAGAATESGPPSPAGSRDGSLDALSSSSQAPLSNHSRSRSVGDNLAGQQQKHSIGEGLPDTKGEESVIEDILKGFNLHQGNPYTPFANAAAGLNVEASGPAAMLLPTLDPAKSAPPTRRHSRTPSWIERLTGRGSTQFSDFELEGALPAQTSPKGTQPSAKSFTSFTNKGKEKAAKAEAKAEMKVRPVTPNGKARTSSVSLMTAAFGCVGAPGVKDGGDAGEEVGVSSGEGSASSLEASAEPAGITGLLNLGNTCFFNAAFQPLRLTPGLTESMVEGFPVLPPELQVSQEEDNPAAPSVASTPALTPSASPTKDAVSPILSASGTAGGSSEPLIRFSADGGAPAQTPAAPTAGNGTAEAGVQAVAESSDSESAHQGGDVPSQTDVSDAAGEAQADPAVVGTEAVDTAATQTNRAEPLANGAPDSASAPLVPEHAPSQAQDVQGGDLKASAGVAAEAAPPVAPAPAVVKPSSKLQVLVREARQEGPLHKGQMLQAFANLAAKLETGATGKVVDPSHMIKRIAQHPQGSDLINGYQQDCHEVANVLLQALHADLRRNPEYKPRAVAKEDADAGKAAYEALPEDVKAQQDWDSWLASNGESVISDLFGLQTQSSVCCSACSTRRNMYEGSFEVSLELDPTKSGLFRTPKIKISSCLESFCKEETMEDKDNLYKCDKCNKHVLAHKRVKFHRLPRLLLVHLKRYQKLDGKPASKHRDEVDFDLKGLSLKNYVSKESGLEEMDCLYDLNAITCHYGDSLDKGHYKAFCAKEGRKGGSPSWFVFNDDKVERLEKPEKVKDEKSTVYLLWYSRRERVGGPPPAS